MYGVGNIQAGNVQANPVADVQIVAASGGRSSPPSRNADGNQEAHSPGDGTPAVSGGEHTGLRDRIVQAVRLAVTQFDPKGEFADLRRAIQGAVDDTLLQNGIDPRRFQAAHREAMAARRARFARRAQEPPPVGAGEAEAAKRRLIASILGASPREGTPEAIDSLQPFLFDAPPGSIVDRRA